MEVRIAALVLGVLGGLFGFLGAGFALAVGSVGTALEVSNASQTTGLGWAAFVFGILGFLGAGLAMAKPRLGAILLIVSALGVIISISMFGLPAGALFFIGGILAFFGRKTQLGSVDSAVSQTTRTA
jgi:hypothetical protein